MTGFLQGLLLTSGVLLALVAFAAVAEWWEEEKRLHRIRLLFDGFGEREVPAGGSVRGSADSPAGINLQSVREN